MSEMFPVLIGYGPRDRGKVLVPWALVAPHEKQAMNNHSQTLERLAERGGLAPCELAAVLADREWHRMEDAVAWALIYHVAAKTLAPPPEEMPIPSQHDIVKAHNDLDQAIGARDYGRLRNFALAMATVREIRKAHSSPPRTPAEIGRDIKTALEKDYPSKWLMRHEDGHEWETSDHYTSAEIHGVQWKARPVKRIPPQKERQ